MLEMKTPYTNFKRGKKIGVVLVSNKLTCTSHTIHKIYINK
jgi:hypothetical protein